MEKAMKQTFGKYLSAIFMACALVAFAGCESTAQNRGTVETADDAAITAKVKTALINDPAVKANEINVNTYRGVVQLTGFVSSNSAATRAVEIASNTSGVKSVKNDMRLK
jgi:osmotically-inducible protein OsmY